MQELVIFTGNIGCGKSFMARKYAKRGYVIVNMDSITTMVHGGEYGLYNPELKFVYRETELSCIYAALDNGFSVVIDRTCMKISDRKRYLGYADDAEAVFNLDKIRRISLDWGVENGIENRLKDPRGISESTWRDVFFNMAESYEAPTRKEGFDELKYPDEGNEG